MNSEFLKIKQADRNPVKDIDAVIIELNTLAAKDGNPHTNIQWVIGEDSMGPCLQATIKFKRPKDCLNFSEFVYELQEAADHHSNFVMENFHTITMMLSTHHPVPAITSVDVSFAEEITRAVCH